MYSVGVAMKKNRIRQLLPLIIAFVLLTSPILGCLSVRAAEHDAALPLMEAAAEETPDANAAEETPDANAAEETSDANAAEETPDASAAEETPKADAAEKQDENAAPPEDMTSVPEETPEEDKIGMTEGEGETSAEEKASAGEKSAAEENPAVPEAVLQEEDIISDPTDPKPYACHNAEPETDENTTLSGAIYRDAIRFTMGYTGYSGGYVAEAYFNLRGMYSSVSFTAGYLEGHERDAKMTVISNGSAVIEKEISYKDGAKRYTVPTAGASRLVIRFESDDYEKTHYAAAGFMFARSANWSESEVYVSDECFDCPAMPFKSNLKNVTLMEEVFGMGGYTYRNGFKFSMGYLSGYTAKVAFQLQGEYQQVSFDIAKYLTRIDETDTRSAYLTISIDGDIYGPYDKYELKWNDLITPVAVPVTGAQSLEVSLYSNGYNTIFWTMGNIQMKSNGNVLGIVLAKDTVTLKSASPMADLKPRVWPSDARNRKYAVTNDSYITSYIDEDRYVYGRHKGTSHITAVTEEGNFTAECTVKSELPAVRYYPSHDGWGFDNSTIAVDYTDEDGSIHLKDYYEKVYRRFSGYTGATEDIGNLAYSSRSGLSSAIRSNTIKNAGLAAWYTWQGTTAQHGICHGMAVSSAITYTKDIPFSTWGQWETGKRYSYPGEIRDSELTEELAYSSAYDLYLKQFIFGCFLSQFNNEQMFGSEKDLEGLIEAARNFQSTGKNPVVLSLNRRNCSHTLVPYDVLETDDEVLVFVYDCLIRKTGDTKTHDYNSMDNEVIRFKKNAQGGLGEWEYRDSSYQWTSADTELAYIGGLSYIAERLKKAQPAPTLDRVLLTDFENAGKNAGFSVSGMDFDAIPLDETPISLSSGASGGSLLYADADASYAVSAGKKMTVQVVPGSPASLVITPSAGDTVTIRYTIGSRTIIASGVVPKKLTVMTAEDGKKLTALGFKTVQITTVTDGKETKQKTVQLQSDMNYALSEEGAKLYFTDVTDPKKAAYKAIYTLAEKGIVKGYGTWFDIGGQCTRAQFVLFLWRLAGKPAPKSTKLSFKDAAEIGKLAPDYTKAIAWGNEKGIVMGFTSGANKRKFLPNEACTRGQVVMFLWRYKNRPAAKTKILTFKDASEIKAMAPDYTKAILWASEKKITTGYPDQTFRPNQKCTRGECVTFLYRM